MFGYQIDVAAEATAVKPGKAAASALYTLMPQHADDANARFQFRMSPDQQLKLLPNRYVQSRATEGGRDIYRQVGLQKLLRHIKGVVLAYSAPYALQLHV